MCLVMPHSRYVYRTNLDNPRSTQDRQTDRHTQTVTDLHLRQSRCHTAHSQCRCRLSSLFLFRPPSVNKHVVAVSYSQLLCASGLCRSERCQFTDQRPAIHRFNSVRFAVRTHATGLERNVRPALYRTPTPPAASCYSHFRLYQFIYLFIYFYLYIYLYIYLSIYIFIYIFIYLYIYLYISIYIFIYIFLSTELRLLNQHTGNFPVLWTVRRI